MYKKADRKPQKVVFLVKHDIKLHQVYPVSLTAHKSFCGVLDLYAISVEEGVLKSIQFVILLLFDNGDVSISLNGEIF